MDKKKGRGPGPSRQSLQSVISKKKKEMEEKKEPDPDETIVVDPYENSETSRLVTRGFTGIVHDPAVNTHRCEWDREHPENPERLNRVIHTCLEYEYLGRCVDLQNILRDDIFERISKKHSPEHFKRLQKLSILNDVPSLEVEASGFDSVYFNNFTFEAASRAASSVVNLVFAVAKGEVMNGMAFVRPPGHHAMAEEYNGYCYFNNVAIAAEAALDDKLCSRILIVDIDVHHGQGTQKMFYDRKDVLYFSIHRYEHGNFWPYLLESNFNFIGQGDGLGYTVNVPLNTTGLIDDDYLAVVFNLLLPISYEFNPDLIIMSAGYDAAIGCPEGKMNVTPGFYAHLTSLLHGLAKGKIAVVLEGGYFLPTLAEGAACTLKALLGGACPVLEPIRSVHPMVRETIQNVKRALFGKWKCFQVCDLFSPADSNDEENLYKIGYFGAIEKPPFPTRNCYPKNPSVDNKFYDKLNSALHEKYLAPVSAPVLYTFDETMLLHTPQVGDVERPERPERLTSILKTFDEFGVENRMKLVPIVEREFEAYSPHAPGYYESIPTSKQTKDVYVNDFTPGAVLYAVSGLLCLIDEIMAGKGCSGIALIRPPGHHAEYDKPQGFCFLNNVAVAANYFHIKYDFQRILIVDFDIHHGNGTQSLFYTNPHVMYISIHRDDDGKFFPANSPRNYTYDGHGAGKGFNINIPFNKDKMSDTEYIAVFHNIILPAAYSYGPQVVLVSAGFDAGINDPLGGYAVNPETFGHMIAMLKPLAEGKMIIALEGGYNLTTTSYGMGICAKALLGDPIVMPRDLYQRFSKEAIKTIRNVTKHFKQYYEIFAVNNTLPNVPVLLKHVENFTEDVYSQELSKKLDATRIDDNQYVQDEINAFNSSN
uniref:Histone deacetylase 6 n=1 Tax=Gnatocerus cornutus TaxID=1553328 RepID=A0A1L7N285_9CUCU|nr:histone deacetylase 6 [Gnatocerus cornutus]